MPYKGQYKGRLRHGQGTYTFDNGTSFQYVGNWENGKMHGKGVLHIADGEYYEGNFQDGEINGVGLRTWANGSTYYGDFLLGERHGKGIYISGDKAKRYEGHWISNQRCGYGEQLYRNGDIYKGEFALNQPHGHGILVYSASQHVYEGNWVEGKMSGHGVLRNKHGSILYEGNWADGFREGIGDGVVEVGDNVSINQSPGLEKRPDLSYEPMILLRYNGIWSCDYPLNMTTKLVWMTDEIASSVDELKEIESSKARKSKASSKTKLPVVHKIPHFPPIIQLPYNKKVLPKIYILSMATVSTNDAEGNNDESLITKQSTMNAHANQEDNIPNCDTKLVEGEYGRMLRLEIFKGSAPKSSSNGVSAADIEGGKSFPGFVNQNLQPTVEHNVELQEDTETVIPWTFYKLIPAEMQTTNNNENTDREVESDSTTSEVVDFDTKPLSEVIEWNNNGKATFNNLALHKESPPGKYFLKCESPPADCKREIECIYIPVFVLPPSDP